MKSPINTHCLNDRKEASDLFEGMAYTLNFGNAIEAHDEMSLNDSPWDAINPPAVSMDAASAISIKSHSHP